MVIDRAIVSTDDNSTYYEFWPLTARGWKNMGIEPTVAAIGKLNLNYAYGTVIKMPGIEGISTGFIAQVIRFIIPCFFPEEVSVIGDIDMIPLSKSYFTKKIASYDNDSIVVFSADAYKTVLRYPMCYIAAKGKYFQQIIGLKDLKLSTITAFIKDLAALDLNWDTDELFFAAQLNKSPLLERTILLDRGGWKPFARNRIDRVEWRYSHIGFCTDKYIDAHSLRPMHDHLSKLKGIMLYLDKGSDGRKYGYHLLKKPVQAIRDMVNNLRQKEFNSKLYNIAEVRSNITSKNKIVAFCLYGNDARYVGKLDAAIQSYQKLFTDWKCRVYVANDVEPRYIQLLINEGCEVVIMEQTGVDSRYTQWRFLAIEDKDADAVIIRDLDSFAIPREKIMVDEWLASGKKFHIIRDHVNHSARIMAGMWGIRKNDIDIKKETHKLHMTDTYGIDQIFLEQLIYPAIRNDVLVHDSFPRFPEEAPVVIPLLPGESYIGEINTDNTSKERDHQYTLLHSKKHFEIV